MGSTFDTIEALRMTMMVRKFMDYAHHRVLMQHQQQLLIDLQNRKHTLFLEPL